MDSSAQRAYVYQHRRYFVDSIFEMMEKNPVSFKTCLKIFCGTPDFLNRNGLTPLQIAAGKGDSELVCLLLERGANHSYDGGVEKNSPLHVAAAVGDVAVCETLLQYWAAPYVLNHAGKSPGQVANENGHFACATLINNFLHDKYMNRIISQANSDPQLMLPPVLYGEFYTMVRDSNLNPLKIALNSLTFVRRQCFPALHNSLKLLRDNEVVAHQGMNMTMLLKLHFICCVFDEFVDFETNTGLREQFGLKSGPEIFLRYLSPKNRYKRNRFALEIATKATETFPLQNNFHTMLLDRLKQRGYVCGVSVLSAMVNQREEDQAHLNPCEFCGGSAASVLCEKCRTPVWCNETCKGYDEYRHQKVCQRGALKIRSPTESATQKTV